MSDEVNERQPVWIRFNLKLLNFEGKHLSDHKLNSFFLRATARLTLVRMARSSFYFVFVAACHVSLLCYHDSHPAWGLLPVFSVDPITDLENLERGGLSDRQSRRTRQMFAFFYLPPRFDGRFLLRLSKLQNVQVSIGLNSFSRFFRLAYVST